MKKLSSPSVSTSLVRPQRACACNTRTRATRTPKVAQLYAKPFPLDGCLIGGDPLDVIPLAVERFVVSLLHLKHKTTAALHLARARASNDQNPCRTGHATCSGVIAATWSAKAITIPTLRSAIRWILGSIESTRSRRHRPFGVLATARSDHATNK